MIDQRPGGLRNSFQRRRTEWWYRRPDLRILEQLFAWALALAFDSQGLGTYAACAYGDRCCQYGNLGDIPSVAPFW